MKLLVIVDMQNDFIDGSLGSDAAKAIVPNVVKKIEESIKNGDRIVVTQDTHYSDYLSTLEGKKLPVVHCVANSDGWQINDSVYETIRNYNKVKYINKSTFGSYALKNYVDSLMEIYEENLVIDIVGLVLDICVLSNAMILKTYFPEATINVYLSCTAATSNKAYNATKLVLNSCHINTYE